MLTSTGPAGQTHWGDSTANNASSGTQSADAQLKVLGLCLKNDTFLIWLRIYLSFMLKLLRLFSFTFLACILDQSNSNFLHFTAARTCCYIQENWGQADMYHWIIRVI